MLGASFSATGARDSFEVFSIFPAACSEVRYVYTHMYVEFSGEPTVQPKPLQTVPAQTMGYNSQHGYFKCLTFC